MVKALSMIVVFRFSEIVCYKIKSLYVMIYGGCSDILFEYPLAFLTRLCLWLGKNWTLRLLHQPKYLPKNRNVRSQACCDHTASYCVAGMRPGPMAVSLAKAWWAR